MKGWDLIVEYQDDGRIAWMAVVPPDDLRFHPPNAVSCACRPRVTMERTADGQRVPYYVHSAFDGRELVERLGLQ